MFAAVSGTLILTASIFAVHYWKEYKRHCEIVELIDSIGQERKQFLEERLMEIDSLPELNGTLMNPNDPLPRLLEGPHPR